MQHGRWVSLRSLLAALLTLAVCAGGASTVLVSPSSDPAAMRAADDEIRRVANLLSEKLGDGVAAVGRDASLAATNAVFERDARVAAIQQFLGRWRSLHPDYADVLFADRAGRVVATASGAVVGSDVSGTTWFARALSGVVIGDASDRSAAGAEAPRNVIVGAPVRGDGAAATGVLAVQLTSGWIEEAVAGTRRVLGGSARKAAVQVINAGGRSMYRSGGAAPEGEVHEASAAVGEESALGWLVLVKGSGTVAGAGQVQGGAALGPAALLGLALTALAAAILGWKLGARLSRALSSIRHAAAEDATALLPEGAGVTDIAELADAVEGSVARSVGRDRIQRETRAALARSRDRVRAVKLLGGLTCWEVDLRNGKVTWADGSAEMADSTSERADDLDQVLSRIDPQDRNLLSQAMRAACAEPASIREAVVRTLAGPDEAAGRRLLLRLTAVALNGQPVRLHVLSREIGLIALPAPAGSSAVGPAQSGRIAAQPDGRADAIVSGLAEAIGENLSEVLAAATALDDETRDRSGVEAVLRHARRGTVLTRKLAALTRREGAPAPEDEAGQILAETLELIRSSILPDLAITIAQADGLPKLACTGRQLEVALLNLASDARDSLPEGSSATLAAETIEAAPDDAGAGLRVRFRMPVAFRAGRGVAAVTNAMDDIGGTIAVEADADETVVTLFVPAAEDRHAEPSVTTGEARTVLLVEPDPVLRAATAESLSGLGCRVTAVASADAAREALAARRDFTLLLCAHAMPALNGVLLAEVAARTHPAIDIVLLASGAVPARNATSFRVLQKPFGSDDLAQVLGAASAGRRSAA